MNQLINTKENDVIDISLESVRRKRFRIDKDDNRILELDTTDLTIVDRLQSAYDKLTEIINTAFKNDLPDAENIDSIKDEGVTSFIESFKAADTDIRAVMDSIFSSNVSEVCAPTGSMLDPINGKFRFEHIFDTLIPLYETDIASEMTKFNARIQKHTSKYIKG